MHPASDQYWMWEGPENEATVLVFCILAPRPFPPPVFDHLQQVCLRKLWRRETWKIWSRGGWLTYSLIMQCMLSSLTYFAFKPGLDHLEYRLALQGSISIHCHY